MGLEAPSSGRWAAAAWRLRVDDLKGGLLVERALERRRYSLGRDKQCDLCLPAREVSREHAALECDEAGRWWLVDLGSTSGTFVNGRRIAGRRALSAFDVAYVGEYRLELRSDEARPRPASLLVPPGREREAPARVRVYEGRLAGRDLRLDRGRVVFGEGPDAALPLEGGAYEGVRVVIRPLKEGGYEVTDESASASLTVDGRPASSFRLGGGDALLGLGPVARQRANALDAFSLRYLPLERPSDETPVRGGPAGEASAGGEGPEGDENEPASGEGLASDIDVRPARGAEPARAFGELAPVTPLRAFGELAPVGLGAWPDVDFGDRPAKAGMEQTVELKRPSGVAAPASVPPENGAPPPSPSRAEGGAKASPIASPPEPTHMGQTMVRRPPAAEREGADAAPVSLSAFVRPLAATLSSPPEAGGRAAEADDAFGIASFGPEADPVNRTLKVSAPAWPAQREALRARAEAAPRRWWLPGALLALLAIAALAFFAGARRRPPPVRALAAGVASSPAGPPAPSAAATAAESAGRAADPPEAPSAASSARLARPARGPGPEGGASRGDEGDPERRRRLQELCKQRLDCPP